MDRSRTSGNLIEELRELSKFFQGKDEIHKTANRLIHSLERAAIPYAIMGGMALYAHGYRRATQDVNVLLTPEGFDEFKKRYLKTDYSPSPGRSRRLIDRKNEVMIDFLLIGLYPGTGKPGPISFPNPADVGEDIKQTKVVSLAKLIELKLAAQRYKDFGDVMALIRIHGLDEAFQDRLHPSVRRDYIECLEEKRRDDESEAQG